MPHPLEMPQLILLGGHMKFITLAVTFLSLNTFANICSLELQDKNLWSVTSDEGDASFVVLNEESTSLSKEEFEANPIFKDFDYNDCQDALKKVDFLNPATGSKFSAIYTIEDHCDGGNSYGTISLLGSKEVISTIQDSDFYCL